ncbi:tetratricopeptide repeat protein [Myxacorys almedinensis]|uniref:Tetratricopeptide repeat protein n=1 Tax=Myxacorys almedinensis A TaxID=2690445 RepID=A0A8J7Z0V8_9CYAN|nr:tetratricopeptide repeat protein [Myxacorys almedinensis]NDJ17649.1 tetratricopeptide repeat protein [Myxacorys almedinensis A]
METKKWLNITEYLLLAGSGIGSVASIASQQLAVAAAPMSFLLLLSLVNRQRVNEQAHQKNGTKVAQLDQKLSRQLESLDQQIKTLPTLIDFGSFTRSISQRNEAAIAHLQSNISQRLAPLEAQDFRRISQDMADCQHKYTKLSDSLAVLTTNLNRFASANRVEGTERAIAQFQSDLTQLQAKLAEVSSSQKQGIPRALQDEIYTIHRRLNNLPQPFDATTLKQDVDGLIKIVGDLVSRRDLARLMAEVEKIRRHHQQLEQTVAPMKAVNTIMRKQMDTLSVWAQARAAAPVDPSASSNPEFKKNPESRDPEYKLMFGLKASCDAQQDTLLSQRSLLEEALKTAQSRVIVVFPYPDRTTLDAELMAQFQAFLSRGSSLDIGWGHLGDVHGHQARYIHDASELHFTNREAQQAEQKFLTTILGQLAQLKREYPQQFRFKVLGTNENFLVCDRTYAILGVQPVTTASTAFPEIAVGVQTRNAAVVEGLIGRYDNPLLAADDEAAYYNRAVTRYALGDKQGAIADYSEVVRINPNHCLAYNNRALVQDELENREDAIADLNRAILSNPRNCIAYCNRGVIRLRLGELASAIEDFSYAIQVDSDCANAFAQRGLARLRSGNETSAIDDFTALIRIVPQSPVGYFQRGLARSKTGDKVNAIRDFKEAAWLFSTQGDQVKYQHAIAAIHTLRSRYVAQPFQDRVLQEI